MIDDLDALFWKIYHEVWVTMRTAYVWPAVVRPLPRHKTRALTSHYSRPVIRAHL